jgi:hypothetical protein
MSSYFELCHYYGKFAIFPAQMVGLDVLHSQSLSGEQLDTMTDDELDRVIDTVSINYVIIFTHTKTQYTYYSRFIPEGAAKASQIRRCGI